MIYLIIWANNISSKKTINEELEPRTSEMPQKLFTDVPL